VNGSSGRFQKDNGLDWILHSYEYQTASSLDLDLTFFIWAWWIVDARHKGLMDVSVTMTIM